MTRHLDFARRAADTLWARQTAALADNPSEPRFLTITTPTGPSWTSVALRADGHYDLYPCPEQPMDMNPTRLDLNAWGWMERLSAATGDPVWEQRVSVMADLFAIYGFDPRSGLGYLGVEAQWDVVRLGPAGVGAYAMPKFKPGADLPTDRLWRHAPAKMDRMMRSAFLGLITRPDRMDYNRYCFFGSDDRPGRPFLPFSPQHVAFAQTASVLIRWWTDHFLRTGSQESLGWAQAMADKWRAVQHPETGLIPHWFGSDDPADTVMPPRPYANARDCWTAVSLCASARALESCAQATPLARQLGGMALRLTQGLARYGYDPDRRVFPSWLRLADGAPATDVIIYAFPTQSQKDEAVLSDARVSVAPVFAGDGLFRSGPWSHGCNNPTPLNTARCAELTGGPFLIDHLRRLADHIMERSAVVDQPFNDAGQWTAEAAASHARMMLILHRLTGEARYRDSAVRLADGLMAGLERSADSGRPEWWRFPFRNGVLDALLDVHAATA